MADGKRPWQGWYKLARWQRRREEQFNRQPLCEMCLLSEEITAANTADHIRPHRGDPVLFWEGALQSLCAPCHSQLKQREELGQVVIRHDANGWPI